MKAAEPTRGMTLLPPHPNVCHACAVGHGSEEPHNAQSLYYQYQFYGRFGRWPTWADAVAHCNSETQRLWRAGLQDRGAWTEPTAGDEPIDKPHRLGRGAETTTENQED